METATRMITWRQVEKYLDLCERYTLQPRLEQLNYTLVNEESAQQLAGWYPNDPLCKTEDYIIIMPDGEHYYHDAYLADSQSMRQWLYGIVW
jgi:hypothetical protein|tara:strand:- start:1395 stop:1670 length:276 start_codon:yes stop_codon:yes gene_type:complete